jgi:xylulokinase
MTERYLLGYDIGTTNSKGVLVDPDLNVVASASIPHGVSTPEPGWAEHDAESIWWEEFTRITRQLLDETAVPADRIVGIGISALAPSVVPLDDAGDPIRPGMLYGIDTRAKAEIELLNDRIGTDRIYDACGNSLTYQSAGPKLLWYKRNEPSRYERTDKIVDAVGYAVSQLTGEYVMDNAIAAFYHPLYDLSAREWNDAMVDAVGIDRDLLPETKWATEIAGEVTPAAAEETGLAAGTPVVTGTVDALASLVGVGGVDPGDTVFMYGTTGVVYTTLAEARTAPELWANPHCLPGRYVIGGGMATSGAITEWFVEEFVGDAPAGRERYAWLEEGAREIPPGAEGLVVLPYFSGGRTPINDDLARGTITGLTLDHTKFHVYRAILESVGYGFRHNLSVMERAGVPVDRVLASGGGAESDLWRQVVSDVTGVEQEYVTTPVGAPLGVAYLTGLGTDVFDGLDALKSSMTVSSTTAPDPERHAVYDEYYGVYEDLYPSMQSEMHRVASLGNESG